MLEFNVVSKFNHPIKFYKFILKTSHLLCAVPKCSNSKFLNEISRSRLPESELEFYRYIRKPLRESQLAIFLWSSLFFLKGLYYSVYMIFEINALELNYDIGVSGSFEDLEFFEGMSIAIFGCLLTNCTKLSPNRRLVQDLTRSPLFAICKPNLNKYYMPMTGLDATGLSISSVFTFFVFLVGIAFIIKDNLYPTLQESALYPITLKYSTSILLNKISAYLLRLSVSYQNYCGILDERSSFEIERERRCCLELGKDT